MIIDNFGTIKPNLWRRYVPRIVMPVVDEAADFSQWQPGPLMVVPEPQVSVWGIVGERIASLPPLEELERAALDTAQDGLMRAIQATRVRHEEMRRAGSLGEWHAAAAVEGT